METQRRATFDVYSQNVLDLLGSGQQLTRAEISSRLGIARTVISPVLSQLHHDGAIVTVATRKGEGRGRNAEILAIDPASVKHIGVEFSHNRVEVILANGVGEELASESRTLPAGATWESRCAVGITLIRQLVVEAKLHLRYLGSMAVGLPGSASWNFDFTQEGYPSVFPNRSEIEAGSRNERERNVSSDTYTRVADTFFAEFGVPVTVDHGIRFAAIAEAANHSDSNSILYIRLSSGVGGAVIESGQAIVGSAKLAGEIGHMCVDHGETAPRCRCGKTGCLEAFVSITALKKAWREAGHPGATFSDLRDAARQGTQVGADALRIVEQAAAHLGRVIGYAAVVIDPDLIVISGEVGDLLLSRRDLIQAQVNREILPVAHSRVCGANVTSNAGAIGAVIASMAAPQQVSMQIGSRKKPQGTKEFRMENNVGRPAHVC